MKRNLGLLLILIIFTLSCDNSNIETEVNAAGKVIKRIEYIGNGDYFETIFYENGAVKSEGKVVSDTKSGIWKEYFSDGELRWEGEYVKNIINNLTMNNDNIIKIVNNPHLLLVDQSYKMRINIPEMYLLNTRIGVSNGKVFPSSEKGEYDYLIEPDVEGDMAIFLYLSYEGEVYEIGTKSIRVSN